MQLNPKIIPQTPNNIEELERCDITASHLTYQPHCDTLYTFYLDAPEDLESLYIPNLLLATPLGIVDGRQRVLCTTHYCSAEPHVIQPERSMFEHKVLQAFKPFGAEFFYRGLKHKHGDFVLKATFTSVNGGWVLLEDKT